MSHTTFELSFVNGDDMGKRIPLVDNCVTLGRSKKNAIVVNDPSISRHHLTFQIENHQLLLKDAGSSHGTFVNGNRVASSIALNDRDTIQAGDQRFEIHVSNNAEEADETVIFHDPGQIKEQFEEARVKESGVLSPPPAFEEAPTEIVGAAGGDAATDPGATLPHAALPQQPQPSPAEPAPSPAQPALPVEEAPIFDSEATRIINPEVGDPQAPSDATRIMNPHDQTRIMQQHDQTRVLQSPAAAAGGYPTTPAPVPGGQFAPPPKNGLFLLIGLLLGAALALGITRFFPPGEPSYEYYRIYMTAEATEEQWKQVLDDASNNGYTLETTVSAGNQANLIFKKLK